ncbi:MAG: hypothetical protein AAGA21_13770 [Pseudomonadota bacterium]
MVGLLGLTLVGCQEMSEWRSAEGGGTVSAEDKIQSLDGGRDGTVPEMAIQVSDDLFMIPTGVDEDGCETFTPFSTSDNPVKTAVHFRQADGGFGIARDPDVCRVEMLAMEPDDDGCERYRAQPVNADLPVENEVIYYRTADDSYKAWKPKSSCS